MPRPILSLAIAATSLLRERVGDRRLDDEPIRRDAGLPGVAELRDHRAGDRGVEIGVGEHHERRVAAELERDALEVVRALPHQIAAPTSVEPVKLTLRIAGARDEPAADPRAARCRHDVDHARRARRPRAHSCASASATSGVCSAGLATTVQPAASAAPSLRVSIAYGKFHGVISAHGPTGSRVTVRRCVGAARRNRLAVDPLGLAGEPVQEARRVA